MNVQELTVYIGLAVFLQIAFLAAQAFYRHWQIYQGLKSRVAGFNGDFPEAEDRVAASAPTVSGHAASWEGYRDFKVARRAYEDENRNVCSFYLEPVDGEALPDFRPGQFLTFRLDVVDPTTSERKEIVRCYSLSDRPDHGYYRISVKREPAPENAKDIPPGLSSNHLHDNVREGDVLAVRAPGGHFFLEPGPGPIVLIAGGIGITPMLSMLNATLEQGGQREVWLFYGLRNSADHVMKAHLETLAEKHPHFRLHICYSRPLPGDRKGSDFQHEGHVDIALLRLTLPLKPYHFYVCGSRAMMESLVPALDEWGVPDPNIHYEAFGPASLARPTRRQAEDVETAAASTGGTVTFSKAGKSVAWNRDASSLLDLAEENGIDVPSGCRAGGCGSCQTTIEEGEVEYGQAPDFDPDPGTCLLCISRPRGDLVLSA